MATMTKQIVATFTQLAQPIDTLTPTIIIIDITNAPTTITTVVNGVSMYSLGSGGGYGYNYADYDPEKNYYIIINGGNSQLDQERYAYTSNQNEMREIVNQVWNEEINNHLTDGSTGQALYQAASVKKFFGFGF